MAKYCTICRQSYSAEYGSCPFCEVPSPVEQARLGKSVSTDNPTPLPAHVGLNGGPSRREMGDRATPVGVRSAEPHTGPSDRRDSGELSPLGPLSSAKVLLSQGGLAGNSGSSEARKGKASQDQSDNEIDLGSPVLGARSGDEGPPSGASFVSWAALMNARKDFEDDVPAADSPVAGSVPVPVGAQPTSARSLLSSPTAPPAEPRPSSAIWLYVAAFPIGALLAVLLKLIF